MDLVTIVTVTYNAEDLLEETILSVIGQDYENIEYIIIDGGSTDGTLEIIKKYEEKIDYWISEPDEGIYSAMNKAIEKATGEWINFMNAGDTFVDKKTISIVMHSLEEDTDVIFGDHMQNGKLCSVEGRKITRLIPCCHQSLFVKTHVHKKYPYNTMYRIAADYEVLLKMHLDGKKFQYIKKPIANYLRNGFSDQNQIRWQLENLTLMMNNHIDLGEIIQSSAYNLIENKKFSDLQHKYNIDIEKSQKKFDSLQHKYDIDISIAHKKLSSLQHKYDNVTILINEFFSIKFYRNPINKLKALRRLYLFHKSFSK